MLTKVGGGDKEGRKREGKINSIGTRRFSIVLQQQEVARS